VKSNKGGKKRLSLFVVLFLVLQVMGVFSAVHAILVTRTPQGAIAWSVSLVAMPVIAVPAYWFLGRSKFQGYVDARRDNSLILSDERKRIDRAFAHYVVTTPRHYPEYQAIRSLAQSPFLKGNHTQLLVDGKATYDSLHEGIEAFLPGVASLGRNEHSARALKLFEIAQGHRRDDLFGGIPQRRGHL